MSLINQMLQDLDARHADGDGRAALPNDVRPLPTERPAPWPRFVVAIITVVLLVGGALVWQRAVEPVTPIPGPPPPTPMSAAPGTPAQTANVVPIVAAPAVADPRALATTAPPPALPQAPLAPEPQAPVAGAETDTNTKNFAAPTPRASEKPLQTRREPVRPDRETRLKVATSLLSARDKSSIDSALPVEPAPAAQPAMSSAPKGGEGPSSIEKQDRSGTARERAENEYRKALGLLNSGRPTEAMAGFRAALQTDPSHTAARLALSGILIEQRRLDEAQALLREALAPDPAQPQLALRLARVQVERGDLSGAEETLRKSAPAAGGNAEFRGLHAAVLQRLARHKDAVAEYQAALRLAPQSGIWWMGLGISLEADGQTAEARGAFQRAKESGALSPELAGFVDQKIKQLQ